MNEQYMIEENIRKSSIMVVERRSNKGGWNSRGEGGRRKEGGGRRVDDEKV